MDEQNNSRGAALKSTAGKYLTFGLGNEEYGLEILKVREIIGLMDITKVPRTPDYIRGVINLRGKIIPVLDLRRKFAMPVVDSTDESCIIVVDVTDDNGTTLMGLLVDSVCEVLRIAAENLEPAPSFGKGVNSDFIQGMAKIGDQVKILLNIENVLSAADVVAIHQLAEREPKAV
jgi:purine-binding chemotaxis protein CheW